MRKLYRKFRYWWADFRVFLIWFKSKFEKGEKGIPLRQILEERGLDPDKILKNEASNNQEE